MGYGQDSKIGLAFQTSWGTAADTSSLYNIPFISESVTPERPELIGQNNFGRFDEGIGEAGPQNVGGTIQGEAQSRALGVFLKALCGSATTTQVLLDVNTHKFTPMTADFDVNVTGIPMTYYKNVADGASAYFYKDLIGTALELSLSNGEFLMMNMTFTGGGVGMIASLAVTDDLSERFTWDVTSIQLGGAANTEFSDLTITIDEQASVRHTLRTSRDPSRVKRDDKRQVRVSGTLLYNDPGEYNSYFLANSYQALTINLKESAVEIQSGYYDEVLIEIPRFKYLAYPIPLETGELQVSFEGKADYHAGSGHSIAITVQNTQANY